MTVHVHDFTTWIEEPGHQSRTLEWVCVCECGFSRDRPAWRVLVTGARDHADRWLVRGALEAELKHADFLGVPMVAVEGQCPYGGADKLAEEWAMDQKRLSLDFDHDPIPANWDALGSIAGPYRNQQMVDLGANVCLAFPLPGSRGTWDCVRRAEAAGIPVKVFE